VSPRRTVIVAGVFVVLLVAGTLTAALGGSPKPAVSHTYRPGAPLTPSREAGPSGLDPVSPVTVVAPQTPIQQQYDQALAQGLESSSTLTAAEASQVPAPDYSASWPPLPVAYQPEQWAEQFVTVLLDINFSRQTRDGLGSWLSATEAPELLPGIPPSIRDKVAWLSLFDTAAVGGTSSPIPSAATWRTTPRVM